MLLSQSRQQHPLPWPLHQRAPVAAKASVPVQASVPSSLDSVVLEQGNRHFHAGPAVRKMAREFGVELALVKGSGPRGRIIKEDLQAHVKARLKRTGASL